MARSVFGRNPYLCPPSSDQNRSSHAHRRTLPHLQLAPHLHPGPHRQSFHGHAAPAVPHAPDDACADDDFAHDACAPMDDVVCADDDVCLDDLPPKMPPRKPIYRASGSRASREGRGRRDAARERMTKVRHRAVGRVSRRRRRTLMRATRDARAVTTVRTRTRSVRDACSARARGAGTRCRARRNDAEESFRGALDSFAAATLRAIGGVASEVVGGAKGAPIRFPSGPREDVALELAYDPLKFIERASRAHGDAVGLTLAGERVVLVSSPALARDVLLDKSDSFQKEGTAFFPGSSLAGNGLLVSDGETWARQRRLSNPAFRKAAVETYARCMVEVGGRLVRDKWSKRGVRDVYADFNDATLEIVARALFGTDVAGARASKINGAIKDSFEFFGRRAATGMVIPEWAPTFDNIRYNDAVKRLDEEVYAIIAKRRDAAARGDDEGELDLLDRLLRATDDEDVAGSGMSDRALRDELMTLMVAGQETSAILLSWACALIAERPEVGDKIAEEVRELLKSKGVGLDAGDFRHLPYTEACILETLRIRPPAYMVGRCASRDVELHEGVFVTKGTTVLIAPYLVQRDPKYWNDPTAFKPERWLVQSPYSDGTLARDALKNLGPNDAYFPFGGGPRVCIGTGFAMMESVLLLALICSECELRIPPNANPPEPKALITLRLESCELAVAPRPRKI